MPLRSAKETLRRQLDTQACSSKEKSDLEINICGSPVYRRHELP